MSATLDRSVTISVGSPSPSVGRGVALASADGCVARMESQADVCESLTRRWRSCVVSLGSVGKSEPVVYGCTLDDKIKIHEKLTRSADHDLLFWLSY